MRTCNTSYTRNLTLVVNELQLFRSFWYMWVHGIFLLPYHFIIGFVTQLPCCIARADQMAQGGGMPPLTRHTVAVRGRQWCSTQQLSCLTHSMCPYSSMQIWHTSHSVTKKTNEAFSKPEQQQPSWAVTLQPTWPSRSYTPKPR